MTSLTTMAAAAASAELAHSPNPDLAQATKLAMSFATSNRSAGEDSTAASVARTIHQASQATRILAGLQQMVASSGCGAAESANHVAPDGGAGVDVVPCSRATSGAQAAGSSSLPTEPENDRVPPGSENEDRERDCVGMELDQQEPRFNGHEGRFHAQMAPEADQVAAPLEHSGSLSELDLVQGDDPDF
jgi:hypothetical protein